MSKFFKASISSLRASVAFGIVIASKRSGEAIVQYYQTLEWIASPLRLLAMTKLWLARNDELWLARNDDISLQSFWSCCSQMGNAL